MVNANNLQIYLATHKREDGQSIEDNLVLDGFDVSVFPNARALWDAFQQKPGRLIIADRRYNDAFSGLDLVREVRAHCTLPYVYIVLRSVLNKLEEIKEGLALGVDDYLIKPHHPFQLRSRILVAMRWLNYIDSLYEGKSAQA